MALETKEDRGKVREQGRWDVNKAIWFCSSCKNADMLLEYVDCQDNKIR